MISHVYDVSRIFQVHETNFSYLAIHKLAKFASQPCTSLIVSSPNLLHILKPLRRSKTTFWLPFSKQQQMFKSKAAAADATSFSKTHVEMLPCHYSIIWCNNSSKTKWRLTSSSCCIYVTHWAHWAAQCGKLTFYWSKNWACNSELLNCWVVVFINTKWSTGVLLVWHWKFFL